jgi:hypothetical protein
VARFFVETRLRVVPNDAIVSLNLESELDIAIAAARRAGGLLQMHLARGVQGRAV